MIDLNYKPKKQKKEEKETPFIVILLALLPFAALFYIVLTTAFLNGIY